MFVNMSCTYSIFASISSFYTLPLCLFHVSVGHLEWWWCLVCLQLLNLHHCFIFDMGWIVVGLSLPPAPQSLGVVCGGFVSASSSLISRCGLCGGFVSASSSSVSIMVWSIKEFIKLASSRPFSITIVRYNCLLTTMPTCVWCLWICLVHIPFLPAFHHVFTLPFCLFHMFLLGIWNGGGVLSASSSSISIIASFLAHTYVHRHTKNFFCCTFVIYIYTWKASLGSFLRGQPSRRRGLFGLIFWDVCVSSFWGGSLSPANDSHGSWHGTLRAVRGFPTSLS